MELKRRRNKRRENLKGCQGALCLKQPCGMKCGVQTLFYSPSSVCTKTMPWMLHGLPTREKRNENGIAAFPFYRSCLMIWVIRDCRAKVAIFHYKSHFNSPQSHLLVEEKRENNPALVLLLWSAETASLKNARNESSSGQGILAPVRSSQQEHGHGHAQAGRPLGAGKTQMCLCFVSLECKVFGKLIWTEVPKEFSGPFSCEWPCGQEERGSGRTRLVGDSLSAPRLGAATGKKNSSQKELKLL